MSYETYQGCLHIQQQCLLAENHNKMYMMDTITQIN